MTCQQAALVYQAAADVYRIAAMTEVDGDCVHGL
jgi:hypothetical protein